jgi:hypothetical protein
MFRYYLDAILLLYCTVATCSVALQKHIKEKGCILSGFFKMYFYEKGGPHICKKQGCSTNLIEHFGNILTESIVNGLQRTSLSRHRMIWLLTPLHPPPPLKLDRRHTGRLTKRDNLLATEEGGWEEEGAK